MSITVRFESRPGSRPPRSARQVKVLGEMAPAWARVVARHVFGAHAEQAETPRWPAGFECSRAVIYLVRGEPRACAALASAIERQPGRPVGLAENGSQGLE